MRTVFPLLLCCLLACDSDSSPGEGADAGVDAAANPACVAPQGTSVEFEVHQVLSVDSACFGTEWMEGEGGAALFESEEDFTAAFDSDACEQIPVFPEEFDLDTQRVAAFGLEASGAGVSTVIETDEEVRIMAGGSIGGAQPPLSLILVGLPKSDKPVAVSLCVDVCNLCP